MDDLKRFAKNDEEQTGILSTVRTFTYDTKMDCSLPSLDKCAKAIF